MVIGSHIGKKKTKHPETKSRAMQESCQHFFFSAAAAVIENKQRLAPTLHRDCGINNSSFGFMMNSSGPSAPFLQCQDLNRDSFNSAL